MIPADALQVCERMAREWRVSPEVHPEDFIFRFVYDNPTFASKEKAIEYYFNDGANSAAQLKGVLTDVCRLDHNVQLLEFASGYGCVTRHLKNVVPFCDVTVCDIHEEAITFIRERLATRAALSASDPGGLKLPGKYDAVFALSFFSHMPKRTFHPWMNSLAACLKPGGYLIFTTHGLKSARFFGKFRFDEDGFFFRPDSEQKDLDTAEYGSTVVKPRYVIDRIYEIPGAALAYFREGYWWGHQDLFVVRVGEPPEAGPVRKLVHKLLHLAKGDSAAA